MKAVASLGHDLSKGLLVIISQEFVVKKSRFTESQTISIFKEAREKTLARTVCEIGISFFGRFCTKFETDKERTIPPTHSSERVNVFIVVE